MVSPLGVSVCNTSPSGGTVGGASFLACFSVGRKMGKGREGGREGVGRVEGPSVARCPKVPTTKLPTRSDSGV